MTATTSGRPYDAARTTDSGVPPTPTQTGRPPSVLGNSSTSSSGGRTVPSQLTGLSSSRAGEQLELLGEEHLVVLQGEAEERERLGERAPPAVISARPLRDGVEGREPLEDPHRLLRAEHGHRRTEPDPPGPAGDRREQHVRRADREVGPVVLADAEEVDADAVGQHRLLDHLPQRDGVVDRLAVRRPSRGHRRCRGRRSEPVGVPSRASFTTRTRLGPALPPSLRRCEAGWSHDDDRPCPAAPTSSATSR